MVQPNFNDASKPVTLDDSIVGKDQNNLDSESSEKMVDSEKNVSCNSASKYVHLVFTFLLNLRLFTLIFTENVGPVFVEVSKHYNFTSVGLNFETAAKYLLWFSALIVQLDALWHALVSYNLFAGTGDKIIKFDRLGILFKYCVPQLVGLLLLVNLRQSESYLQRRFQSVLFWQMYTTMLVKKFDEILNADCTPIRGNEDLELDYIQSRLVCAGLVLLLKFELDVDFNLIHNQFPLFFAIYVWLLVAALIWIKWRGQNNVPR